ncbi:hypothetical protein ACYX79_10185 [Stenotrophomonas rhizophila]
MLSHVLHFVLPDLTDAYQIIFCLIIFAVAGLTAFGVWARARPANWETNWEGSGRGTGLALDVDHGSFNDVCDAVATKPEKYADIVPGMLLIFGLLGTFIGLGIALDSASAILTSANAQGALDGGMKDLMAMMGGLGTKFKTSTWGILGFLLLKLTLSAMGRETERQQWVITRMKQEMDRSRQAGEQLQEQRSQRLEAVLFDVAVQMDTSFNQRLQHDREARLSHNQESATALQGAVETLGLTLGGRLSDVFASDRQLRMADAQARTLELGRTLSEAVQELQDSLQAGLQAQYAVAERSADAVGRMVDLQVGGNDLAEQTHALLRSFTESQKAFSDSMQNSADTMSAAASSMNGAAGDMSTVITSFEGSVKSTLSSIESGLGSTIGNMDESLRSNLGEMSTLLGGTATTLQSSLETFSDSTGETLAQVTASMRTASDSQRMVMADVRNAMCDVQEMVQSTVGSIEQVGKKLNDSLRSVAKCSLEMTSLVTHVRTSSEAAAEAWDGTRELLARDGTYEEQMRAAISSGANSVVDAQHRTNELLGYQAGALDALRVQLESFTEQTAQLDVVTNRAVLHEAELAE